MGTEAKATESCHGFALYLEWIPDRCEECGGEELILRIGEILIHGKEAEVPGYSVRCRRCGWGAMRLPLKEKSNG